jgi:hypothetical protein
MEAVALGSRKAWLRRAAGSIIIWFSCNGAVSLVCHIAKSNKMICDHPIPELMSVDDAESLNEIGNLAAYANLWLFRRNINPVLKFLPLSSQHSCNPLGRPSSMTASTALSDGLGVAKAAED